ncbi:MAG: YHS domain-containing protein [Desulfuromonadales bacterium]|nr:YHS domain-containing protein [Desulfuromonadales bacterium]
MNPLRILILAALFYILYRLLFGPAKKTVGQKSSPYKDELDRDVLVEDPVCHVYVPQGQAVTCQKDGQIFYFCSDKCCNIFLSGKDSAE